MTDDRGWCWSVDENANGPYPTREAAIEAAREAYDYQRPGDPGIPITVGRCEPLTVGMWAAICIEAGDIVERMQERAAEEGVGPPDDEIFWIDKPRYAAADRELEELLEQWAEKYVDAATWFTLEDGEEVVL